MKRTVDWTLGAVLAIIFAVVVASVTWQVISRYVLGTPSTITSELARILFMWLAMIGSAYTFGQGRHLAIDLLPLMLTGRAAQALQFLILLLVAGFAAMVMVWGGWQLVSRTLASGQITPILRVPMGYAYAPIPFSGLVILFYCAVFARDAWNDPGTPPPGAADAATPVGSDLSAGQGGRP